jgi:glycosyltransferase involved in cell wall biosynthesis
MHVALISDALWLDEQLPQFQALVVGLMDEQVRVVQVVPHRLDAADTSAFGEHVPWKDSNFAAVKRWRLSQLASTLQQLEVDLIHALTGRVWSGAISLAKRMDVPVIFSDSSWQCVSQAAKFHRKAAGLSMAYTTTTLPLAQLLHKQVGPQTPVQTIAPGIHHQRLAPPPNEDTESCAVITGTGIFDESYQVLIEALKDIVKAHPNAQFFFDGQQQDQHKLWRAARKAGLLANVSLVPRRLGHHELLLRGDILIQPQALGASRSLTLQAMAQSIPVIAREDRWLDYLIQDETALLIYRAVSSWIR